MPASAIIVSTVATPIVIPVIVSTVCNLFRRSAFIAIGMTFLADTLERALLEKHPATAIQPLKLPSQFQFRMRDKIRQRNALQTMQHNRH